METVNELNQQIEDLKKQIHLIKRARAAEYGFLHSGEYSIMRLVAKYNFKYGTSPSLVKLSSLLEISQATVTPLVDRLVQKELLIKEVSEEDKRVKLLSLTEKGKEFLQGHYDKEHKNLQALVTHIGEQDTQELIRLLGKVREYFNTLNKK